MLYEDIPIANMEGAWGEKGCSDGIKYKNSQVSLKHSCSSIHSHSSSMTLDVKMAPLCVTKKIQRTPLRGVLPTSTAAAFSLFLSFSCSFLPSSLFLHVTESVTVSGRGEDLSRNTNTHHLNENSSLPPPQLSQTKPPHTHTHKHITIDCHVRPRYPLQPSWLLDLCDNSNVFQKSLRDRKLPSCFALSSEE